MPVYVQDEFWGFVGFDDCRNERLFTENEVSILRSAGLLIANALLRHNMNRELTSTLEKAQAASRAKSAHSIERKDYALGKIEDASTHLLGVINDILDMSKIEADKLELHPEVFVFEEMLKKAINIINFRIVEKHQRLSVYIDENIPRTLICDDQRLAQVITNLLSNAGKFTPENGTITLNTKLLKNENENKNNICEIQFEVIDTGVGISEEQQTRLFNPFEQAESNTTRKFGGTGLGLAIAKRIVEMMGGRISVSSEVGKGSVFTFTVKAEKSDDDTEKNLLAANHADIDDIEDIRILIVDDDADIREYFVDIAMRFHIVCETAASGEEAIGLIAGGNQYDICFIDWNMPGGMDGIELSRHIKEINGDKAVIIMISSIEWTEIEHDAKEAGIDEFLPKPVFPSTLIECINKCFGIDLLNDNTAQNNERADRFWGYRVLLAEDVEINREIVTALLEPTLLEIDCAENGAEAVRMFSENPDRYNLIFMDLQMPEMDGYEATRSIRAIEMEMEMENEIENEMEIDAKKTGTIPIIAMTANVFKEDVDKCLEAGMNDHIGKPLDFDSVLTVLRRHLFRQKPAKERRKGDRRKSINDRRQMPDRRKKERRQEE
jgi:CheY-like chemotaxis protein